MIQIPQAKREAAQILHDGLREIARRKSQRLFYHMYPDQDTPTPAWALGEQIDNDLIYARDKYSKHMAFFRAGAQYPERCFRAANRIGKTMGGGGYELSCHLTGEYPDWWEGRRYDRPIRGWAAGKTERQPGIFCRPRCLEQP